MRMSMELGRLRLALLCPQVLSHCWLGKWRLSARTENCMMSSLSANVLILDIRRIGEKFLEWTDTDPALDDILESVTLYWLTDTFPRCIYPYRGGVSPPFSSSNYSPFFVPWFHDH